MPACALSPQAGRLTAACTELKHSACDLLEDQAANWARAAQGGQAAQAAQGGQAAQAAQGGQAAQAAQGGQAANAAPVDNHFQVVELYTLYLNTVSSSLKVSSTV